MKLVVAAEARADLLRLRDFLSGKNERSARRAVAALLRAIEGLAVFPARGRPVRGALRELIVPFGNSAYVVRYAVSAEAVIVLRIWHGREAKG